MKLVWTYLGMSFSSINRLSQWYHVFDKQTADNDDGDEIAKQKLLRWLQIIVAKLAVSMTFSCQQSAGWIQTGNPLPLVLLIGCNTT